MKKILFLVSAIILFISFPVFSLAEEYETENSVEQYSEIISEQLEASGANELKDHLPDETLDMLSELGINDIDFEAVMNISPKVFWNMLVNIVSGKIPNPVKIAASIMGVILLCSTLEGFKSQKNEQILGGIYSLISVIVIITLMIVPIMNSISYACSAIKVCSDFMLIFIPIITAILSVSGNPISASKYNLIVFAAAELISRFSSSILVPFLCIYLCFSITSAVTPIIQFERISESINKGINTALGFCAAIFTGMLSLQGMVSSSADTVASRGAKFIVSSFVPVVGGAISEGLGTIQGCMGLVKSAAGAYGIIAALCIFLPVIIELVIWIVTLNICGMISGAMQAEQIEKLMKSVSHTLSVLLSISIFCGVLLIVSGAVVVSVKSPS